MKSALDMLIEELEARAWERTELSPPKAQPVESRHAVTPGYSGPPTSRPKLSPEVKLAACGSPHCAGCYDVGDEKKIHPPKCGEDYLKWLERWKPTGKAQ
jgi:hypothetical protein